MSNFVEINSTTLNVEKSVKSNISLGLNLKNTVSPNWVERASGLNPVRYNYSQSIQTDADLSSTVVVYDAEDDNFYNDAIKSAWDMNVDIWTNADTTKGQTYNILYVLPDVPDTNVPFNHTATFNFLSNSDVSGSFTFAITATTPTGQNRLIAHDKGDINRVIEFNADPVSVRGLKVKVSGHTLNGFTYLTVDPDYTLDWAATYS